MHFCPNCSMMFYITIVEDDPNKLIYYCRNCGFQDENLASNNISICKLQIKKGEKNFSNIINKYTKLDPTIPRNNKIPCPNAECKSNTHNTHTSDSEYSRDVLYIRYDDINIKYVYLCSVCDTTWKVEE
jgi:DNA-directed RNA polymerase subunit M/transcription elongation factor TFIIS